MYGVELMIIISTTLAQSLCGESKTISVIGVLIFYRVIMGIGVGGDCEYSLLAAAKISPSWLRALKEYQSDSHVVPWRWTSHYLYA